MVNAATARARITGESAVALSQHGTVAPVTVHHRVDFAASMIDGRTVGEVVPGSQSAKEISELWLYIQDRLSRIVRDPSLLPQVKPEHLAINSLRSGGLAPTVLNAANEIAVQAFLDRRIGFLDIPRVVGATLDMDSGSNGAPDDLDVVLGTDARARVLAEQICQRVGA